MSFQRVVLLEAWKEFEQFHGTPEELAKVTEMMPRVVKKWRKLEDGSGALEECELNVSLWSLSCFAPFRLSPDADDVDIYLLCSHQTGT